ncbi:PIN domain-containing protein [Azospirillum sp. sgz302134]
MLAGIDTNILLYAADNAGDQRKHARAVELLDRISAAGRGKLPLQALTEFYAVAIRKERVQPERAAVYVDIWADVFPVKEAMFADAVDAIRVQRTHGIAFWDAMMWSVARRAGARLLLSEDFQDGRDLEGVRFLNPFNPANTGAIDESLGL